MMDVPLERVGCKKKKKKKWQKMAYLQPYFKDSKAFSQLCCQGFEHLILINFCISRRLKIR